MKKLISTIALVFTLTVASVVYADQNIHGKESHYGRPSFLDALPKDKAAQFHETMKQAENKNLVLINKLHELREGVRAALTAPKFDKEAYIAKRAELDKFHETLHQQMKANTREAFATALSNLSHEERQALAASMDRMKHHHRPHHEGHWHHHDVDQERQSDNHDASHDQHANAHEHHDADKTSQDSK